MCLLQKKKKNIITVAMVMVLQDFFYLIVPVSLRFDSRQATLR